MPLPHIKMIDIKTAYSWGEFCEKFGWIAVSVVEFVVIGILFSTLIYVFLKWRKKEKELNEHFYKKYAEQEAKHEKETLERDAWWKDERIRIGKKFDDQFDKISSFATAIGKQTGAIKMLGQAFNDKDIVVKKIEKKDESDLTRILNNGNNNGE